jgi:CheY-like chemotaxis protein
MHCSTAEIVDAMERCPVRAVGARVLCIDEDAVALRCLSLALSGLGFHVAAASGGDEGFEIALAEQPDAVIADLSTRTSSGVELVCRFKSDPRTARIPLIALARFSGLGRSQLRCLARQIGAEALLARPFDLHELIDVLQRVVPACNPPEPTAAADQASRVLRVLSIDDDSNIVESLRRQFRRHGIQLLGARCGREGYAAAVSERPDVIITDLMMPDSTGAWAIARLKSDPRTSGIPILVLSGHGELYHRQSAGLLGASRFLAKPTPFPSLLAEVRRHVESPGPEAVSKP